MKPKKIIKRLVGSLNTTIPKLAKDLNCSEDYLYSINSDRRDASDAFIRKVIKKYPKVNPDFLKGKSNDIILGEPKKEIVLKSELGKLKTPGERIRFIRKSMVLTQKEFAKKLKTNLLRISSIEFNRQLPPLDLLILMKEKGMISTFDEIIDGTISSPEVEQLKNRVKYLEKQLSDIKLEYEKFRKMMLSSV